MKAVREIRMKGRAMLRRRMKEWEEQATEGATNHTVGLSSISTQWKKSNANFVVGMMVKTHMAINDLVSLAVWKKGNLTLWSHFATNSFFLPLIFSSIVFICERSAVSGSSALPLRCGGAFGLSSKNLVLFPFPVSSTLSTMIKSLADKYPSESLESKEMTLWSDVFVLSESESLMRRRSVVGSIKSWGGWSQSEEEVMGKCEGRMEEDNWVFPFEEATGPCEWEEQDRMQDWEKR